MVMIKKINHVAVLVEDIESALKFWQDTLGLIPSKISDVPKDLARIVFLPVGESDIELVQPTSTDSGLSRFLEKRGPGIHHLSLEVDDIQKMMDILKSKGVSLINDQPKLGDDGRLYAFIHPKSTQGVLVELYQVVE